MLELDTAILGVHLCVGRAIKLGCKRMQLLYKCVLFMTLMVIAACSDGDNASNMHDELGDLSSYDSSALWKLIDEGKMATALEVIRERDHRRIAGVSDYLILADIYIDQLNGVAAQVAVEKARFAGALGKTTASKMARALMLQRKFDQAEKELLLVELTSKDGFEALLMQGQIAVENGKIEQARKLYSFASDIEPNNNKIDVQLAILEISEGNWLVAKQIAEKAAQIDVADSVPLYLLGAIARQERDPETAAAYLQKAVTLSPNYFSAKLELVGAYIDLKDRQEAEKLLADIVSVAPQNSLAQFYIAVLEAEDGNMVSAEEVLLRTGEMLKTFLPAKRLYGHVTFELGKYELAANSLRHVLDAVPDDRKTRLALAESLRKTGLADEALDVLEPILNVEKRDLLAQTQAASANMALGNFEPANQYHETAVELAQEAEVEDEALLSSLRENQAVSAYAAGNYKSAIDLMKTITKGSKASVKQIATLANMQISSGDLAGAIRTTAKLKKQAPDQVVAYNLEGSIAYRMDKFDDAVDALSKALTINPDYPSALKNRALTYSKQEKYDLAKADLDRLAPMAPQDGQVHGMLGDANLALDDFPAAIRAYEQARKLIPTSPSYAANHAHALGLAGFYKEALVAADEALKLAPKNKALQKYLQPLVKKYKKAAKKKEEEAREGSL